MRVTFLCPHLRIAGGVRAILTYADRLAGLGHAVTVVDFPQNMQAKPPVDLLDVAKHFCTEWATVVVCSDRDIHDGPPTVARQQTLWQR